MPHDAPHGEPNPSPSDEESIAVPAELEAAVEEALRWRESQGREPLPAGAATRLATHAHLMLMANETRNLTRITAPREIAVKHILDSLAVADLVSLRRSRVLDIGTGAGFPGIPLAIAVPSSTFVLLDGTEKKIAFVDDAIEALQLPNAAALQGRAEVHLKDYRYDFLVARAVGPIDRLLPLLLSRRDRFSALLAMKGPAGVDEWNTAEADSATRGFELAAVHEEELPDGAGRRTLLVIVPSGRRPMKPQPGGRAKSSA